MYVSSLIYASLPLQSEYVAEMCLQIHGIAPKPLHKFLLKSVPFAPQALQVQLLQPLPFPATCSSKQHPIVLYLELTNSCLEEQSVQIRKFYEMELNMIQLNHGKEKQLKQTNPAPRYKKLETYNRITQIRYLGGAASFFCVFGD
jgi:hypothetical protein